MGHNKVKNMWNYRIIKKDKVYGLYETYYNDNQEIFAVSDVAEITGESPEDILDSLQTMLSDTKKHFDSFYPVRPNNDVLEYDKIEFASIGDEEDFEEITIEELQNSITGSNMPPLDWTDPDVEVND